MARIRTYKPSFFKSEDVAVLPFRTRLTWLGLWCYCDDAGRGKDNVKLIKADVWPLDDVSLKDIEDDLQMLAAHGRIVRYEAEGQRYLEVVNFDQHQRINRPTPSKIPPPSNGSAPAGNTHADRPEPSGADGLSTGNGSYPQVSPHGGLTEDSHQEGKGREGKGTRARGGQGALTESPPTQEPPQTCPQHPNGTADPCGPCKDARLAHDRWRTAKNNRSRASPRCRIHRGQPADNCAGCRGDQLARSEED